MEVKKIWFRAKHYGWGWYPCTLEGWAVLLVWILLFFFFMKILCHEWLENVIVVIIFVGILVWVSYKKGEKPGWRWGK